MKLNEETIAKLRQLLGSWTVFYQKTHTYHWDLKGQQFLDFHKHLEKLYNESVEHTDAVAERLRQLGEKTGLTLVSASSNSVVEDKNDASTMEGIASDLITAIAQITMLQTEIFNDSDGQGDYVTADLMTQLSKWCEFNSWFLSSLIGNENATNV